MCGLQTLVEPSIAVGILRWILGTRLSFFLTCWVLFYCPICDPLIISMLFFRLFGIGHGMSWYHMTFLLASSMYMTKQDRNCTMLGIPWWISLNYSCTCSRIFSWSLMGILSLEILFRVLWLPWLPFPRISCWACQDQLSCLAQLLMWVKWHPH